MTMNSCPRCGKEFDSERSVTAHFAAMKDDNHTGSIAKQSASCEECGQTDEIYPSRRKTDGNLADKYFCSKSCRASYYGKKHENKERVICKNCKSDFDAPPSDKRMYCSVECTFDDLSGDNSPHWRGGHDYNYGTDWPEIRSKVIRRDYECCRLCRKTRKEEVEQYDKDLEVHHKMPFRTFDDKSEANRMSNLITLCRNCHAKVESNEVML